MKFRTALALCAATILPIAANAQTPSEDTPTAAASVINVEGKVIGSATLFETPNGVIIRAELEGLEPGELSLHIHETGKCEADTKFESAGAHFNPAGAEHGFMVEGGPHAGDMPNQFVGEDGKLSANLVNTAITIGAADADNEARTSIIDEDGSALVIHSGKDDYVSQPAGEAGDRIACGIIETAPK